MPLIEELMAEGWLRTPAIIDAFRKIKRADFLPPGFEKMAEEDEALSIGHNQTISQPLVVALMLELLQPKPGEKVLDVGSGSGWTTSLLAEIVGEKGKVVAIERIPELAEQGRQNADKYGFVKNGRALFVCADGSLGYETDVPFDKILVSASLQGVVPSAWKNQLKVGGRIVTPINNSIWLFIKRTEDKFEEVELPGFVFVPLISG